VQRLGDHPIKEITQSHERRSAALRPVIRGGGNLLRPPSEVGVRLVFGYQILVDETEVGREWLGATLLCDRRLLGDVGADDVQSNVVHATRRADGRPQRKQNA